MFADRARRSLASEGLQPLRSFHGTGRRSPGPDPAANTSAASATTTHAHDRTSDAGECGAVEQVHKQVTRLLLLRIGRVSFVDRGQDIPHINVCSDCVAV